ncbi:MAG: hypothetical protein QM622_03460 [Microbacterium sp.]
MATMTTAAPTLESIARLLNQSIDEQREAQARIDARTEAIVLNAQGLEKRLLGNEQRTYGVDKRLDGLYDTMSARFLQVDIQLSDIAKRFDRLEDHVAFLATKAVEHDKRLDAIEKRLDAIETRIDNGLGALTDIVLQIRDAVIPGAASPTR